MVSCTRAVILEHGDLAI